MQTGDVVVEKLGVKYKNRQNPALADITFSLDKGVTSLVGRNGSGKSTLLRILATLQTKYSGNVKVLGLNPANSKESQEIRSGLGYLPQNFLFTPAFTVEEFLQYMAWLKKVSKTKRAKKVDEALKVTKLEKESKTKMGALSGGMLRRAGIAQTIINDPQILILDEPASGLDPEQRIHLRKLIQDLAVNRTVITSTHLIEEIEHSQASVLMLTEGQITFHGTKEQLMAYDNPNAIGDTPIERAYTNIQTRTSKK